MPDPLVPHTIGPYQITLRNDQFMANEPPAVDTYVSYPADRSTKRAILLLTDVIGHRFINAQLIADQLAANGYFVVMPDLFHGDPVPLNLPAGWDLMAWLNGPPGHLLPRVEPVVKAVFAEMKSSLGCERIGAIGYCFGVGLSEHTD